MAREHNWADNHTFEAGRVHQPTSIDDVRRLVAASPRVHAVGARHSFNSVADSPGDMIDLGKIDPNFAIDPERRTVTVGAATNYGVLAVHLHEAGWALHNMASLPHVTVAGATMTGTHGSGDRLGNLATAVVRLEMVTAAGDLVTLHHSDDDFPGAVVSLGALGIVTRVTLDIEPGYTLRQDAYEGLPWASLLSDIDAVMSAGYSVSLMTNWSGPTVRRWWIKTRADRDTAPRPPSPVFDVIVSEQPSATGTPESIARLNPFGVSGPWSDRLTHFKRDVQPGPEGHLQSEYMLPRAQATTAIARLREMGERIDGLLHGTEIRSMTGDNLWLSPSYGDDHVALHFSWQREIDKVDAITRDIEALLLPLGGRPHWGKIMHASAAQLEPLYPQLPAFRELARSYDPGGKFRNAFLDAHVFG
jgi:alditol oxidase